MSDEPAYDTGVSSSSSVNGDKVECVIENNVDNKTVDEVDESSKAEIKKTKVRNINYFQIMIIILPNEKRKRN